MLSAVAVIVLLIVGAGQLHKLLPSIHNPFVSTTVDRSGPVLLKSLNNLNTYDAAQANLQVPVDLKSETAYVPSFLLGKEETLMAAGSVEAGVDFSHLDASSVIVDKAHHTVSITLPHATLGEATVDPDHSYPLDSHEGLLDHIGNVFSSGGSDTKLYQAAKAKIAAQAAADPTILQRAEDNTRAMLDTLLVSLGYPDPSVSFV